MAEETIVYAEPVVMGEQTERGTSALEKFLIFLGILVGIGMVSRLLRGKTMDALTLPFRLAFLVLFVGGFFAFLVIGFIVSIMAALSPILIAGAALFLVVKSIEYASNSLSPAKPTPAQLSRIYELAMDDLESGKISDEEFLKVGRTVREVRAG